MIGFLRDGSAEGSARYVAGFRKGLNEAGYVEGQNVAVEYYWLEGQYERLPALLADLSPPASGRDRCTRHRTREGSQSRNDGYSDRLRRR